MYDTLFVKLGAVLGTIFNLFFMLNPNMTMKIGILKYNSLTLWTCCLREELHLVLSFHFQMHF